MDITPVIEHLTNKGKALNSHHTIAKKGKEGRRGGGKGERKRGRRGGGKGGMKS